MLSNGYTYLLSHSLYYEDGSRFTGQPGKNRQYRYYHNRVHDLRIRCDQIDPIVLERMKACFEESERFASLVAEALRRRQESLPKLEAELSKVRKGLLNLQKTEQGLTSRLMDSKHQEDPVFMPWLQDQVGQLKRRREQLLAEQSILEQQKEDVLQKAGCSDTKATAAAFIRDFDKLSMVERRNILERFVSKIVITAKQQLVLHFRGKPLTHAITRWRKSTGRDEVGGPTRT